MKIAYSPVYTYNKLPEGHRFPMDKYDLLPAQLLHNGIVTEDDFFHPIALTEAQILRTHTPEYWDKLKNGKLSRHEIRALGFPFHESLVERGRHIASGTLAKFALNEGVSLNIAGGTHHAFAERGEDFCMFNDFAITANELLFEKLVNKVMIIDLDVHQGNGTANIFTNNDAVFTFSMHGEHNYPLKKEKSDYDLPVEDGIEDDAYLHAMEIIPTLIDNIRPDIVLYLSGVDILATDKLGRLGLTKNGSKRRDEKIFNWCKSKNIPVAVSMGGGYSTNIKDIIDAHANTFEVAKDIFY